jgi:hypothetical protein
LERKHVQADSVVYIGKEANNIDEQELDVKQVQEFIDVEEIKMKNGKIYRIGTDEPKQLERAILQAIELKIAEF